MKILMLLVNTKTVMLFRTKLISDLQANGHEVHVICGDTQYVDEVKKLGVHFYEVQLDNRSFNLLKSFKYTKEISKLVKEINPDITMTFMLKPNTFGVLGLKKAGIKNVYSMIEGMGDTFINTGFKWTLVRKFVCYLYKKAFKYVNKVIVLNTVDKQYLIDHKIAKENKIEQINGIGIDTLKFNYVKPYNSNNYLLIARLLKTKGVIEFCEAAKNIKEKYPSASFTLVGPEGGLTKDDLAYYIDRDIINYVGPVKNVKPYIEDCSYFILPSYREGMPVATQEAMATGRGIITTNAAGCSDTVIEGFNGFKCDVADVDGLTNCILKTIDNVDMAISFGLHSRKMIEKDFDIRVINKKIMEIIKAN